MQLRGIDLYKESIILESNSLFVCMFWALGVGVWMLSSQCYWTRFLSDLDYKVQSISIVSYLALENVQNSAGYDMVCM